MGKESHDKLRRVQDLLRREIPSGDAGKIFERALDLLLERVEKARLGVPSKAAVTPPKAATSRSIRPSWTGALRDGLAAAETAPCR
jgi:hypothetical protein